MRVLSCSLLLMSTLSLASAAYAVSPTVFQAVGDEPLTLTLSNGETRDVRVLTLTEERAIVLDTDGEVLELLYADVSAVHVRSSAPNIAADTPPAAPARETAPRSSEGYLSSTDGTLAEANDATAPAIVVAPPRISKFYMRLAVSTGYARMRLVRGDIDSSWDGFMMGFDGTWGLRASPHLAIHGSVGVRRFVAARSRYIDGPEAQGFHTPYRAILSFSPGLTLTFGPLLLSASAGIGIETRRAMTGFTGEALIGFRFGHDAGGSAGGVAFAFTGTSSLGERDRRPLVEDNPLVGFDTFSVGPRFFFEF